MQVYIFSSVEVKPTAKSEMRLQNPEVIGAFVHCLVGASTEIEAKKYLHAVTIEDGYEIVSEGVCIKFSDYCLHGSVSKEMKTAAEELQKKQGVWYSPFYCFSNESERGQY